MYLKTEGPFTECKQFISKAISVSWPVGAARSVLVEGVDHEENFWSGFAEGQGASGGSGGHGVMSEWAGEQQSSGNSQVFWVFWMMCHRGHCCSNPVWMWSMSGWEFLQLFWSMFWWCVNVCVWGHRCGERNCGCKEKPSWCQVQEMLNHLSNVVNEWLYMAKNLQSKSIIIQSNLWREVQSKILLKAVRYLFVKCILSHLWCLSFH